MDGIGMNHLRLYQLVYLLFTGIIFGLGFLDAGCFFFSVLLVINLWIIPSWYGKSIGIIITGLYLISSFFFFIRLDPLLILHQMAFLNVTTFSVDTFFIGIAIGVGSLLGLLLKKPKTEYLNIGMIVGAIVAVLLSYILTMAFTVFNILANFVSFSLETLFWFLLTFYLSKFLTSEFIEEYTEVSLMARGI
jgi:hypothetical protein